MTSGVDELGAFIAALRVSFLTSSSAIGSPESLRQGIEAFRDALRPTNTLTTHPSPAETCAPEREHGHHSGLGALAQAEEPISSASTIWSLDDRIDALTKQIGLVDAEVREGTSRIRELIQSVKELKTQVNDLSSALVASEITASASEVDLSRTTVKDSASSNPAREARVDPSPSKHSGEVFAPSLPEMRASFHSNTAAPPKSSAPTSAVTIRSGSFPKPPLLSALSRPIEDGVRPRSGPERSASQPDGAHSFSDTPSRPPPPLRSPVAAPTPACTPVTASGDPARSHGPRHRVNQSVQATVSPKAKDLKLASSTIDLQDRKFPLASGLEAGEGVVKIMESQASLPTGGDKEGSVSKVTEFPPQPPVIATVVTGYLGDNEGELRATHGDKITVLDSPETPAGWIYGEIVTTRRGIFLARHVKELSRPETEKTLNSDIYSGNSEHTEQSTESPVIVTAVHGIRLIRSGELLYSRGDNITVLKPPETPPVGWMYGELVDKRQGLFPARYVTFENDPPPREEVPPANSPVSSTPRRNKK
ncbi:hypothetical protein FRC00_004366 [Tulasnella sp. 408]|nr:hypothetical protein FRC00_004366 [Tulasnella sp. 408]